MVLRPTLACALLAALVGLGAGTGGEATAADLPSAEAAIDAGRYDQAIAMATEAIAEGTWNDRWHRLLIEARMVTGQYREALATYEQATGRFATSLPLRMQGIEVLRYNGRGEDALAEQAAIFQLLSRAPSRYSGSENLVTAGRYFASRGEDARKILELFYDRVRKTNPGYTEAYIATAELALSKHDYAIAADALEKAAELDPADPKIPYLAAEAWRPSDSERASTELVRSLEINPRYVPSLLLRVDQLIDREHYDQAETVLDQVEQVNPRHPVMWAYRAVIAHLRGEWDAEQEARDKALQPWPDNPEVDYVIGRELSQKYRFAEGAEAQRRALEKDPAYLEARFQLAQDLLRLGQDDLGWEMAAWTHEEDGYNVVAYNLMNLRDRLQKFTVLERGNLLVRMQAHEAEVYGQEVLDLLEEAERVLCEKYEVTPDGPIVVEIFPNQQDFAIRTFGLPGGDGFLGVCFGRVITANSPASQGENPSNWESVLWHEFCHVVTLSKTNNRMPRWLSEGISVYEERQRDPRWGQRMTATFRKMILGDDFTPISQLSGAFLNAETPMHLQLAYFESALAVEFLIDRYGIETLKRVLVDLGVGMPINESLQRYAGSLEVLDEEFTQFARDKAKTYGERFDWTELETPPPAGADAWRAWLGAHPDNYWGLHGLAQSLVAEKAYEQALEPLERTLELFGEEDVDSAALAMIAGVHRAMDDAQAERAALETLVAHEPDQFPALVRLMELQSAEQDWQALAATAQRALAVNPMLPVAHQNRVDALEHLDQMDQAVRPLRALATMNPVDPAGLHFRTAEALLASGDAEAAKRATLMALEEAPRYREAQQLLLRLVRSEEDGSTQQAEAEQAEPEQAEPEQAEPEQAEPEQAEPEQPAPDLTLPEQPSN